MTHTMQRMRASYVIWVLALFLQPGITSDLSAQFSDIDVSVRVSGVTPSGRDTSFVELLVEEFAEVTFYPLLPYLFFDENSSEIAKRYGVLSGADARRFSARSFMAVGQIEFYHQLLNIIGQRMRDSFVTSELAVVGCTDGGTLEGQSRGLGMHRAEAVRTYLFESWGIDTARIHLTSRALPASPSRGETYSDQRDADQENRRVELSSRAPGLLAPAELRDIAVRTNPPVIHFTLQAQPTEYVRDWRLVVRQGGRELYSSFGGAPVPKRLVWRLEDTPESIPTTEQPVLFEFLVTDLNGNRSKRSGEFTVHQQTIQHKRRKCIADKEFDKYRLILFDFNSAVITAENRRMIDALRERITTDGAESIVVTGYTDRLGDSTYNRSLSLERATSTAAALGGNAIVRGLGESELQYDNDLPEGRFYSRTVDIDAIIPIRQPCR